MKQRINKRLSFELVFREGWSDICSGDNIAPAMISPTTKSYRVRDWVMIGFGVRGRERVKIRIKVRVGVTFNVIVYHWSNTLLKSNVTTWSVGRRCRGSQECGSRNVNFACKFHWRWHAVFGSSHNSENLQQWCTCAVGLREPGNHDNGASDLWTLTAYWSTIKMSYIPTIQGYVGLCRMHVHFMPCLCSFQDIHSREKQSPLILSLP